MENIINGETYTVNSMLAAASVFTCEGILAGNITDAIPAIEAMLRNNPSFSDLNAMFGLQSIELELEGDWRAARLFDQLSLWAWRQANPGRASF